MSYKTYDKLQEVDNTFFKQIPKHWNIFKLKYIINSLESGKRKDFESEDYAFSLGGEHINWDGTLNLKNKRYISKDFYNSMSKGKIQENDTLLVKDGATIGKTAFVNNLTQKMAVNEHVFIIRNNHLLIPKLLYYLIASNLGFAQIKLTETGSAQGGISQDILDKVRFAIPNSLQEQQQIVNYLDKKTAKIDATIAKNEELIKLLEEKRVALINQVVTKGLDPNVPMKDSGIEWIGKIPKHWEVTLARRFCKIETGGTPKREVLSYWENGTVNWMTSGEVNQEYVNETKNKITVEGLNNSNAHTLPKHSIVMALSGQGQTKGRVAILNIPTCCSQSVGAFICDNIHIFYNYLFYYFKSRYYDIRGLVGDNLRDGLSLSIIGDIPTLMPPIEEQIKISDELDKHIPKINDTITKIKENIILLEEYKTSLIHHVVTGKVDVRGEQI